VLLWFAGVALVVGSVIALATLIGPLASTLVVTALLGVGGFLLVRRGLDGVSALSGDEDEREALGSAEASL
jgi:membrane protein implicated in regulation of membrane protease activity